MAKDFVPSRGHVVGGHIESWRCPDCNLKWQIVKGTVFTPADTAVGDCCRVHRLSQITGTEPITIDAFVDGRDGE